MRAFAPMISANQTKSYYNFRVRYGFTLIELLVVIGIMMLVTTMVAPGITRLMQQSALASQAGKVLDAWRLARSLALRSDPATVNGSVPYYGIAITQTSNRTRISVIYSTASSTDFPAALSTALVPLDPNNPSGPALYDAVLPGNVMLSTATTSGSALNTADQSWVIYSQFHSGIPISDAIVTTGMAGSGSMPVAFGVAQSVGNPGSPVTPNYPAVALIQTHDFNPSTKQGLAKTISLYPIGIMAIEDP